MVPLSGTKGASLTKKKPRYIQRFPQKKPASGRSSNVKARFTGPTPRSGLIKKDLRRQELWVIQNDFGHVACMCHQAHELYST